MITITCVECNHSFELPESKIPAATFRVKCPACQKVFQATVPSSQPQALSQTNSEKTDVSSLWDRMKPEVEALLKEQIDTVRSDILLSLASLIGRHPQNP